MLTIEFVLLATVSLALGSPAASGKRSITIPLQRRSAPPSSVNITELYSRVNSLVAKYEAGIAAHNLNTGSAHQLQRRSSTAEELKVEGGGTLWEGLITVGSPTQTFAVNFDTGRADLILPGPDCTTECRGRTKYDPEGSSSSVDAGNFVFYDQEGAVRGEVYRDEISLAGLSVRNQTFGAALTYTSAFALSVAPADGVLGLAFGSASMFETTPLVQALFARNELAAPVFAFKLTAAGPELSLGGVDSALYTGGFTYAPVTAEPFWNIALDGVSVDGAVVLGSAQSMIDTGTPLIVAPSAQARQLYAAVPGSGSVRGPGGSEVYTFPCGAGTTLSLIFSGRAFEVPASMFELGPADGEQSGDCVGAVVGSDQVSFWVVGDTFLQTVYTSFDMAKRRVGFASLK
ncbi:hypothetical protein PHLGIDRAFT_118404 [Phlebiopsis gigantea 11061_1 CR5-6]|uniref:Peptidase A1 domain-containing protein n=1 Tax=Phlebiopsis gigantea (strain 11061_1 CR5-6) TaxID=745531 RepID=A0A0C3NPK8_PHLG1|nr:hypothetical protein PHLGIDRAFT_118404 [Phlebiopsis gigantea 11061_1 CR5-6]